MGEQEKRLDEDRAVVPVDSAEPVDPLAETVVGVRLDGSWREPPCPKCGRPEIAPDSFGLLSLVTGRTVYVEDVVCPDCGARLWKREDGLWAVNEEGRNGQDGVPTVEGSSPPEDRST